MASKSKTEMYKKMYVKSEEIKSSYGGQLAIYCNRHGETACMHFMKDFNCERNFFCPTELFLEKTKKKEIVEMKDDRGNIIRVIPSGFHNYENLFNADDLISAGVFVQEIERLQKNKKLEEENYEQN